jgi:hypothetical protein
VSVTCVVKSNGDVLWFLTKESGAVPECGVVECPRCVRSRRWKANPQGWVVIQAEVCSGRTAWWEAAFGKLCVDTLSVVERRLLPMLVEAVEEGRSPHAERMWNGNHPVSDVMRLLGEGLFSGASQCGCACSRVCAVCVALSRREVGFVPQLRFSGVNAYRGSRAWFLGVSDGIDIVRDSLGRRPSWMTCDVFFRRATIGQ